LAGKEWLLLFYLLEQIQAWLQILHRIPLVDALLLIWQQNKVMWA
jgi:hypothetical protein